MILSAGMVAPGRVTAVIWRPGVSSRSRARRQAAVWSSTAAITRARAARAELPDAAFMD